MDRLAHRSVHALPIACLLALAACSGMGDNTRQALTQVQAKLAPTLPKPYIEDLVIESVKVEGNALVEVIRSPLGSAEKTRRNPRFNELQQAEELELRGWCKDPAIQPLFKTKAELKRRFVDRNGGVFFEVAMLASFCPAANSSAGATSTP